VDTLRRSDRWWSAEKIDHKWAHGLPKRSNAQDIETGRARRHYLSFFISAAREGFQIVPAAD